MTTTTKATGTNGTEERVAGVLLARVSAEHLEAALKKYGVQVPKKADVGQKVAALADAFGKFERSALAECDDGDEACGGASPVELPACPFCGEGDISAESGKTVPSIAGGVTAPAAKSAKKSKGGDSTPHAVAEVVEEANTMANKKNGTAMVPAGVTTPATAEEAKLNVAVAEIRQLARGSRANAWMLGKRLHDVYATLQWKQRTTGAEGKAKVAYKTWDQFVNAELHGDITVKYAFMLMRVATHFTTEQVQEVGARKLSTVLVVPKEMQTKLLESAKGGTSVRALEKEAKAHKPAKATHKKDHSREHKPKAKNAITVASIVGEQTITLYRKPAKAGEELVAAKSLADMPYGFFDLANDVRCFITVLKTPQGKLKARVKFSRIEDAKK